MFEFKGEITGQTQKYQINRFLKFVGICYLMSFPLVIVYFIWALPAYIEFFILILIVMPIVIFIVILILPNNLKSYFTPCPTRLFIDSNNILVEQNNYQLCRKLEEIYQIVVYDEWYVFKFKPRSRIVFIVISRSSSIASRYSSIMPSRRWVVTETKLQYAHLDGQNGIEM